MTLSLPEALAAETGLTCVVGAGGKKSTLYALADRTDEAVVTATVRIPIFDSEVADVVVTGDPNAALERTEEWPVGLVPEREREDRYRGYDPETVAELGDVHDGPVLVKADGARTRMLKAPNEREPQLPANADTVVPVASARVVGKPLADDHVHRPERVAAIAGREVGETVRPEDAAAVLASDAGGLKDLPTGATPVPVVNMVDSPELEDTAREIAASVLSRADVPRVVLTRMIADDPVVAVVE